MVVVIKVAGIPRLMGAEIGSHQVQSIRARLEAFIFAVNS